MNARKKLTLSIILLSLLAVACERHDTETTQPKGKALVYIVTPLSHPSLALAITGFREGLAQNGWGDDKVKIESVNANGEFDKVPNLIKRAEGEHANAIYVLTTPAASVAIKLTNPNKTPLIYGAVTDPISAGIVTDMARTSTYATGVSDRYPVEEQVRFFRELDPNMRSAGLLYNPSEQNSQILVRQTISALNNAKLAGRSYTVTNEAELTQIANRAFSENDVVIVNGDNLVTNNLPAVINVAVKYKKPLFVGDPDSVRRGAVATVGPSYLIMGRQAGQKAAEVLAGKDVRSIPSSYPDSFDYIVNTRAATAMGLNIPIEAWQSRAVWESKAIPTPQ